MNKHAEWSDQCKLGHELKATQQAQKHRFSCFERFLHDGGGGSADPRPLNM